MGFIPPLNLGGFQPSPATLAQWVYQIWQYLQENPIATQEQIQEFIGTFITTSPTVQEMIGEGVDNYLVDNPPAAPVQSVQGKTGAVVLNYPDIVPASNAVPVYRAASVPSVNTLVGQYNLGYRLFVNTATQEIYTITPAGALSLVGRGKFDGTTIDVNTTVGDTTIAEALQDVDEWKNNTVDPAIADMVYNVGTTIIDTSVKLGYCQSKSGSTTQSQMLFNIVLPKELAEAVTGATVNSGSGIVVRAGGSRIPASGTATLGTTDLWDVSSVSINKDLGIVRVTIDIPKSSNAEQHAASMVGNVTVTLTGA